MSVQLADERRARVVADIRGFYLEDFDEDLSLPL